MSSSPSDFVNPNISKLGYSSKQDIIENLFIKSVVESYGRIDKTIGIENDIRDRFRDDLYFDEQSLLKKWLQFDIIYLDWENWTLTSTGGLKRTDFVFKLSGMKFIVECKRLRTGDKKYIDEGLQRFINLDYAQGDEYAGMIGFVISGDINIICTKLHSKISSLEHTTYTSSVSDIPNFNSMHVRKNKTSIEIYHLFFEFLT